MNEIKCTGCGYENDSTRVFCHNCGVRLERPEGETATITKTTPMMSRESAPVSRGGGTATVAQFIRGLLSLAILAALLASLIQMARRPEGVPAPVAPNKAKATELYRSVRDFAKTVYPRTIDLTEAQANNYLASRIEAQDAEGGLFRAEFARAFVLLEKDRLQFVVEQKYLGWPVFLGVGYAPELAPNPATGRNEVGVSLVGARIGRLQLPAILAPLLEKQLQDVMGTLSAETEIFAQADRLVFLPGVARVGWNGSATPGD